ncbi:hypothetical protein G9A89_009641 [Geosiphon pyriformis]|nr:hypothetical protein G9A89_009641 [Geosiphon pyriformis]
MHFDSITKHFNKDVTFERILNLYYWPTIYKDIFEYMLNCDSFGNLFDRIRIDLVSSLFIISKENCYIAVAINYLTKWPEARAIQNKSGHQAKKEIGHNCDSRKTTTITTESLSIIQRTPQQNLQINQNLQISYFPHIIHKNIILQKTSTNNTKPKVAESEIIEANHLRFAKSLFQHYCQYLGLNHNHISAESAFNFYINKKISFLLGTPVNTESARETFYKELIQNTNLSTNHNFASIITEINKEIEYHTQQRYPITYASKGKGKLQTPAKNRVEFPSNPSYHYTSESAINILSTNVFPLIVISAFGQFPFQNFDHHHLHQISESLIHKKQQNQKRRKKNQRIKNSLTSTRSLKTRKNQNPELINQQNLPLVIIIDQLPINLIVKPIQQPLQLPFQQPRQQQLLQQPPQPPNLDPMAYALITKLDNFTGKENDA